MTGFSMVLTVCVSFGVSLLLGALLLPILKKLHFGQSILEEGPSWHKKKQGTPTMGGISFILGILLSVIAGYFVLISKKVVLSSEQVHLFSGLTAAFLFGLIGFRDDYIKVVKKRNLGLSAKQKLLLQILVTIFYFLLLYLGKAASTVTIVPFIGKWDMGFWYYPVMGILMVGIVNSVNLNDGIDGLCASVTFIVGIFFLSVTTLLGQYGLRLLAAALVGGCLAFLCFNVHPAKMFMGDTGSLFLGGMVCALAFGLHMEFLLFFAGFVYCCESLSVILQVISVKTTGKRIFKMSPIHHHFELCGFSENKVVILFSSVTAAMCLLGIWGVILAIK